MLQVYFARDNTIKYNFLDEFNKLMVYVINEIDDYFQSYQSLTKMN